MFTSEWSIVAPNGDVHTATAFQDPEIAIAPQCEQGIIDILGKLCPTQWRGVALR